MLETRTAPVPLGGGLVEDKLPISPPTNTSIFFAPIAQGSSWQGARCRPLRCRRVRRLPRLVDEKATRNFPVVFDALFRWRLGKGGKASGRSGVGFLHAVILSRQIVSGADDRPNHWPRLVVGWLNISRSRFNPVKAL